MRKPRSTSSCGPLERAVLVLDRDDAVVADAVELPDEAAPVDLAEPGQPRDLPAHPLRRRPVAVEAVPVDLHVLRVDVEDARGVVAHGALVVDHQPDEVRRVEVEPEALRRDDREHLVPRRRGRGEVRPARPLVPAEDHGAVLDRDVDALALGVRDEARPDLAELAEVVRHVLRLVAPDERPDGRHAELRRRVDHLAQVGVGGTPLAPGRGGGCSGSRRATRSRARAGRARPGRDRRRAARRRCARRPHTGAARRPRPASRRPRPSRSRLPPTTRRPSRSACRANAAVSRPSFIAAPPPIAAQRFDSAIASPSTLARCPSANVG